MSINVLDFDWLTFLMNKNYLLSDLMIADAYVGAWF